MVCETKKYGLFWLYQNNKIRKKLMILGINRLHCKNGLFWVDQNNKIRKMPMVIDINLLDYKNIKCQLDYKNTKYFQGGKNPVILGFQTKLTDAWSLAILNLKKFFSFYKKTDPIIISGPHLATLTASISLVTDIPFILGCVIKDGEVIPIFAALSK